MHCVGRNPPGSCTREGSPVGSASVGANVRHPTPLMMINETTRKTNPGELPPLARGERNQKEKMMYFSCSGGPAPARRGIPSHTLSRRIRRCRSILLTLRNFRW